MSPCYLIPYINRNSRFIPFNMDPEKGRLQASIADHVILYLIVIPFIFLCCYNIMTKWCSSTHGKKTRDGVIGKTISSRQRPAATAPEVSGAWPVIGHFHLLGGDNEPIHRTLGTLADQYGPAFLMRFGCHKTLVVSDWEIAKECFTTNDKLFSNRPPYLGIKHMFYNSISAGFAPYGDYWSELRKVTSMKLLSNHQLEKLKHLRTSEVEACFKQLYDQSRNNKNNGTGGLDGVQPVQIDKWFKNMTFNLIARVISGNRVSPACANAEVKRLKVAMDEALRLLSAFAVSDMVPWLGWLDGLRGLVGEMKRCAKELDCILETWLEEHKKKRISRKLLLADTDDDDDDDDEENFIHAMLSIMEQDQLPRHVDVDPEIIIKATCLDMALGVNDGPSVTLTWALSLLLKHSHVLHKAQEEVDAHVGKERVVEESDIGKLVYIQAIIKETMRLYPVGPLERLTMDDCEVGGFHVPAGTRLFVNVWKIQRDGNVWKDPLEFRPERFMATDVDLNPGQLHQYKLIPFGLGRRICPGVSFSLQVIHLVLARLIHSFEIRTPMDEEEEELDMTETGGLVNSKMKPLQVLLTPRLPMI